MWERKIKRNMQARCACSVERKTSVTWRNADSPKTTIKPNRSPLEESLLRAIRLRDRERVKETRARNADILTYVTLLTYAT